MMKKTIVLFVILAVSFSSTAQTDIERSEETTVINNKKFYVHTVETGQTLYSICKAYDVSQKDVAKENKLYSSSINEGQKLLIPIVLKEQKDEPDFYWHKVMAGETLYALSNKYNVSVDDIINHNPDSKYGIKTEQIIKIPNISKGNFDYQDDEIYYYTVEKGNTLFSLSQKFGLPIKQIIIFNPDTKDGLRTGQVLRIPKTNYDISERLPTDINEDTLTNFEINEKLYFEEEGVTPCNQFQYDKSIEFNVILLLPLFIDENLYYLRNYSKEKDQMFYKNTRRFIEFYEGILLATDKLKSTGVSVNITVFDTKNDGKRLKEYMDQIDFSSTDLIIGPIYASNVKIAAYYTKEHRINLVSPLSWNSEIIEDNPFIFQVVPSVEMRIKKTSDLLNKIHDTSIVIIHNGTENEKKHIDIYKNKLVQSFSFNENSNAISLKTIDFSIAGEETIEDALSIGLENVVIIPSEDEVFVTQIISKLYSLTENYNIKLIGSPKWERYQNINLDYLKTLSFHYISHLFRDYSDLNVKNFITDYRSVYKTEPTEYSYQGYDIMIYFINALKQYGRHFQFCLSPDDDIPKRTGLIFDFDFVRTNDHGGFENNGTFILDYDENFRLQKSNISK